MWPLICTTRYLVIEFKKNKQLHISAPFHTITKTYVDLDPVNIAVISPVQEAHLETARVIRPQIVNHVVSQRLGHRFGVHDGQDAGGYLQAAADNEARIQEADDEELVGGPVEI